MTDRAPTDDEAAKFNNWYKQGAPRGPAPGTDPTASSDPASGDMPWYSQVGRGLARGVASDIPGLSSGKFATQDDAGPYETGARYVGEYAPFLAPGLDLGLGAKAADTAATWLLNPKLLSRLTSLVGPNKARAVATAILDHAPKVGSTLGKGAIGGVMADPEHPLEGAATGAATAGAVGAVPKGVKSWATKAAGTGAALGGYEAIRSAMQDHAGIPAYFASHTAFTPLAALAASAALHRPGVAGGMGSAARKWWEGDDDQSPQQ